LIFELGGSVLKLRMLYWVIYLWLKTRALQGVGPMVTSAPRRARATRVWRVDVAGARRDVVRGSAGVQTPFHLALFKLNFLQNF
jgi:hypothetical protein